ncbi:MAG: hemerythrin domain-containing protein [Bacteroidia bacterium]|nr:hemerythrin domain-containing protein [Bacteroidia bacterium]
MTITKDLTVLTIVQDNPLLASVIDRFGIPYAKWVLSLEQACLQEDVDISLVLEMLRVFSNQTNFPREALNNLPLESLIEYLIKSHVYYINSRLPRIEQFLDLLVDHYGKVDMQLYLLKDYFNDYKRDLLAHICIEERELFPYVLNLIRTVEQQPGQIELYNLLEKNSITRFINEHYHVEDELGEIKRRLNAYSEANSHKVQITTLFFELRLFELDLLTHSRVEDEILVPRAQEIETQLRRSLLRKATLC